MVESVNFMVIVQRSVGGVDIWVVVDVVCLFVFFRFYSSNAFILGLQLVDNRKARWSVQ